MDNLKLNSGFKKLETDYLYHIGVDSSMDLVSMFGDVKYIILTRSFTDADTTAKLLFNRKNNLTNTEISLKPIAKDERYHIHKVGSVLIASHGVGAPSILILLNELTKLAYHAKIEPKIIRLGLAGSIGLTDSLIIIASEVVDYRLKPEFTNISFGEKITYSTVVKNVLNTSVINFAQSHGINTTKLLFSRDFYDGQARTDGTLDFGYSHAKQTEYLNSLCDAGIGAIDMDSGVIAGFCNYLDIPISLVSIAIINRLHTQSSDKYSSLREEYVTKLTNFIANYIIQAEGAI